ncbi:MAG TPA: 2,3-bisphosphoglycerate-independent phosphoglycerate mutase [Armatimonadetes bacterium]|nr:2,3-bisphosphoglycerate-independent phosphoglycerate mutase [Armatimonadota bacterium]
MDFAQWQQLAMVREDTKIVLLVIDGLGGVPHPEHKGKTELEAANTPHLNQLVQEGTCGLLDPVAPGITPGSGPGHLALFGYDPVQYFVGRGVPEALGSGFELTPNDLAIRGNWCAVKMDPAEGREKITHRRAYRPPTEQCARLCAQLDGQEWEGVKIIVKPAKEHRFLLILRGTGLSPELTETDPQETGLPVPPAEALVPPAERTARLVNRFAKLARQQLDSEVVIRPDEDPDPAEHYHVLLRGYSKYPTWPTLPEIYGLRCAALATYPMYRGLAQLVGMSVLEVPEGKELEAQLREQLTLLQRIWPNYDFFFFHVKAPDKAGEDGDFLAKKEAIEAVDVLIPEIKALQPQVLCVTGDHSTPSLLQKHSWHPVPVVLWGKYAGADAVSEFSERACAQGGLGRFRAVELMPQLLACAGRLEKFGA